MGKRHNRNLVNRQPEGNIFAECTIRVRFNEVDQLGIVWHGHYFRFFEDGREAFGDKYNIDYMSVYGQGYSIPIVEMHCFNLKPLKYQDQCELRTTYKMTNAAKIIFEYHLYKVKNGEKSLVATGKTVQVFVKKDGNLELVNPDFYESWKSSLQQEDHQE
ncbi:MAG: acyl-CoA thioesterase [Bacteroidetes bacterium]|nr:acyl-CoA thioesterase [Bacteroidota bacterium]